MATQIWVNIGSGNGLLPDSTMLLSEPMFKHFVALTWRAISQEMLQIVIKMC